MSVSPVPNAANQELNVTLPSIRRIHVMIRQRERVSLKLLTGDQLEGKLRWIDFECLGFEPESGEQIIIWLQAIAYIQALEPSIKAVPTPRREIAIEQKSEDNEDDPFNF
jgi:host factor-I protein